MEEDIDELDSELEENEFDDDEVEEPKEKEPIDLEDESMDDDLYGDDLSDDYFGEGGEPPLEKHQDLLKELTNFSPYIKDTFNNWLGLTWSEEEEKFIQNPLIKPIMSLNGAAWCVGSLKTYARGNNIITDIHSEDYKNMVADIIESIWLNLGTRDDLGIIEEGDLLRVANELEHASALALMGAGDGKYNKFLGTTYSFHGSGSGLPHSAQQQMMQNGMPMMTAPKKQGFMGKVRKTLLGDAQY